MNTTHVSAMDVGKLMWIASTINGQQLPVMVDTGATPSCVALRCVEASPHLKSLPRREYVGAGIFTANGDALKPNFVITVHIVMGCPAVSITTELLVIKELPYSCIFGQNVLQQFPSWSVCNDNCVIYIGKSAIPFTHSPSSNVEVNFLNSTKTQIKPHETVILTARAAGNSLSPFREISSPIVLAEGNTAILARLGVETLPALTLITHQNCPVKLAIYNFSDTVKTVKKGTKLATGEFEFNVIPPDAPTSDVLNTMHDESSHAAADPVTYLTRSLTHLDHTELSQVKRLLNQYRDIFSFGNDKIGETKVQQFDIDVEGLPPVAVPLHRVPLQHRKIVQQLIDKYTRLGLLERIDSPFRAATVLVKKKDLANSSDVTDMYRLCTDYRALNTVLPSSGWPSPSLQDCLDSACDSIYFSSIDFNLGYYQIACTPRAKEALAFSPGFGFPQFTWKVMPPGIKNASGCFQQAMSRTFTGQEHRILPPYYDDVVIKGKNFHHHLDNVDHILNIIQSAGFTLNVLKCAFFQKAVLYLGHCIKAGALTIDPARIATIRNFPQPTSVTELRRFIGMSQFCSRFIPNLSVILSPVYQLLQKSTPYHWTTDCENAFQRVKSLLLSAPVLQSPGVSDKLFLETDTSTLGVGSCLKGIKDTGEIYIIAYNSYKFSPVEQRWNIVEKEAFAVLHACRTHRHYLIGTSFQIKVDSQIITYLKSKRQPKSHKLLNWALELSEYDYDIIHFPGKENVIYLLDLLDVDLV